MEDSIQQNIYYQNRQKYGNAGSFPQYQLHHFHKITFKPILKKKKLTINHNKKKKIRLSSKAMDVSIFNNTNKTHAEKSPQKDADKSPQKDAEEYNVFFDDIKETVEKIDPSTPDQSGGVKKIFITADLLADDGKDIDFKL
jgi:hypothetical protein